MPSKNSEARKCANTNRASMSVTVPKETNMNIVAKSDYNFQGFTFNPVTEGRSIWFTSAELAKALGYKKTDAISQIYARNADEFSDSMSLTLNMKVNGINNSLRNKSVRVTRSEALTWWRCLLLRPRPKSSAAGCWIFWIGRQNAHRLQNSLLTKNWLISATYNCGWRRVNKCANTSTQE